MFVSPTLDMAETFSKDRLSPFLRDTPILKNLVKDNRARDSGNTLLHKKFPGGFIVLPGANSAPSLASRPVRDMYQDEIDRYPLELEREGDPLSIADKRTDEFWNAKIMRASTPTDSNSRIWAAYQQSDQRQYYVKCPICSSEITLMSFKNLKWSVYFDGVSIPGQRQHVKHKHIQDIYYECPANKCRIDEKHKKKMIREGKWVAQNPGGNVAGFWINAIYKPYGRWQDIIVDFENVKHDRTKLRVFVNTTLAEIFDDRGDAPDYLHIYAKREFYQIGSIPSKDIVFLTAAVDVQRNRFEIEVKGWTQNQESFSVEHLTYMCDTSNLESYNVLDQFLLKTYEHPCGKMLRVKGFAVDTGDNTQVVYTWVRRQELGRVFAIKGVTSTQAISKPVQVDINFKGQKITNGVTLWGVGVSVLKMEFYARLRLTKNEDNTFPFGFFHFPDYTEDFFRQLVSESLTVKFVNGIRKFLWAKIYERNEALDLSIYNRAMALILGIDNLSKSEWQRAKDDLKKIDPVELHQNKNIKPRSWVLSKGINTD